MNTFLRFLAAACIAAAFAAPVAQAGTAPPPAPVKTDGTQAKLFASGVDVPTQITFGKGLTFIAGAQERTKGGIYFVRPGSTKAKKIKGSPDSAYGVVWSGGVLYATQGNRIMAYSKWKKNGFKKRRVVATGPKKSAGFSGLAIGPDNRIYTGASLTQEFDHTANPVKYSNTVMAVKKSGKGGIKVVSRGLRQPWQMTFAKGQKSPIVSVLAQDLPAGTAAPDLLVKATPGSNFGFPTCNWEPASTCDGFTEPLLLFPKVGDASTPSPMGIASRGEKLFVALFNGFEQGPGIVTLNAEGTGLKPLINGFAPTLSVSVHKGYIYIGTIAGMVYRVKG